MIFVSWGVRPEYHQDPFAPRIQLMLRWTAEGSHLWNDLISQAKATCGAEGP